MPKDSLKARISPLLIVATGVCWGCVGLFVRPLQEAGLSNFQIGWLRSLFASAMLLAAVAVLDRKSLRFPLRDTWCVIGSGLVSIVFVSVCYYATISLASLSVAAVLMYTGPAFVLLLSRLFFGERITVPKVVAVVFIVAGCVFVGGLIGGVPQITPIGFLLGLGSGFGYAMYSIFSRFALDRGARPLAVVLWTFLFGAVGFTFLVNPVQTLQLAASSSRTLALVLGLALSNAALPYLMFTIALEHVENGRAAIIVSVEPVVAALVSVAVFGETFAWFTGVGIVLVLAAVALLNWKRG